jgi:heterodisulfide reductase subunit A
MKDCRPQQASMSNPFRNRQWKGSISIDKALPVIYTYSLGLCCSGQACETFERGLLLPVLSHAVSGNDFEKKPNQSKQEKRTMPKDIIGATMVVGGGIAGMQSALDLAESGYYVYLVEKSSAIGGLMSQLDKTFPTNDCAM